MNLEINYKKKIEKITNMQRLNNMPLNNYGVNEEIRAIKSYLKANENENAVYQNL